MFMKKTAARPNAVLTTKLTDSVSGTGVPSIVSADMTFRGDLIGTGDVQVDGRVYGRIDVAHLVIAATGVVEGEVAVKAVSISGTLIGSVRATTVKLSPTARVKGDILHEVLSIEAGAELEGLCKRIVADTVTNLLAAPEVSVPES